MKYSDKRLEKELAPYLDKEGKNCLRDLIENLEESFALPFTKFFIYPLEDAYNKFLELVLIDKNNIYSYILVLSKKNTLKGYYSASGTTNRILKEKL